jgi:predicted Fe-S protein YdhL (DUF1289 family)
MSKIPINNLEQKLITSPCISNCCLDDEDICMGCFRHVDEITGWHSANNERRLEILSNTERRRKSNKR